MIIDPAALKNKKGIIVIGMPRSGTHHLSGSIYSELKNVNKIYLGEIYQNFDTSNILENLDALKTCPDFFVCSFVQYVPKHLLLQHLEQLSEFYLINLRRRNKIEHYRSWCMARLTWKYSRSHFVTWDKIVDDLPFQVTNDDIDNFIVEQSADYLIPCDLTVYYEDLKVQSRFIKNTYNLPNEQIFSNYSLVIERLKDFKYVR